MVLLAGIGWCGCQGPQALNPNKSTEPGAPEGTFNLLAEVVGGEVPADSLSDAGRFAQIDVTLLAEDFETYAPGEEPAAWLATGSHNSLEPAAGVYAARLINQQSAYGTDSPETNLHDHYMGEGSAAWADYTFTGRMMITESGGGVGVTFLSDYPQADHYYRLRRGAFGTAADAAFHIAPHGTTITRGTTNTGVTPQPNQWYVFKIEVEDTGSETQIRAKVWAENELEPPDWQANCADAGPTRLRRGTVGMWSMGSGWKLWDDLRVTAPSSETLDFAEWFDTDADNSMTQADWLFDAVRGPDGEPQLRTRSALTNIHSHFLGAGAPGWSSYTYSGRMTVSDAEGGIGVTFLSAYPFADRYYRLRRGPFAGGRAFLIAPHGTSISGGVIATNVVPRAGVWYRFKIETEVQSDRTVIRAKIWDESTNEPGAWQADCFDASPTRLTHGTVGVWSMAAGEKRWANLEVRGADCVSDTDQDGTADCYDACPDDPNKTDAGVCGCGVSEDDADGDGTPDCVDACPADAGKTEPGVCGCGTPDDDRDGDDTPDCADACPDDPLKTDPGACGCGVRDIDLDANGVADCLEPPPAGELVEDFEKFACNTQPDDWLDTAANNSMTPDDALFRVMCLPDGKVFGTASTATNIHSHYLGRDSATWSSYTLSGTLLLTDAKGGIGITFLSDYPNSDTYYRLRRYAGEPSFRLAPSRGVAIPTGDVETGVVPEANRWYRFTIEVTSAAAQTRIRAKVWPADGFEPYGWQVDASDRTPGHLTAGTVGLWSMGVGSKYWDNLRVVREDCGGDRDGDGEPDCTDACPDDPAKTQPLSCGCGVSEADSDGDGVPDCVDVCPGVPDADSDGDGVPDCRDACPGFDDRADANGNGIPDGCDVAAVTVSVTSLDFAPDVDTLEIALTNAGAVTADYQAGVNVSWLNVQPSGGALASQENTRLAVTVNRTQLPGEAVAHGALLLLVNGTPYRSIPITVRTAAADTMRTAHRTSGVAPLLVFFDATTAASGVIQPANGDFATLYHAWDFGDDAGAVWTTDGRSRNTDTGFVAAHVFEDPGVYTVHLRVTDGGGATYDYTEAIDVQPFAGTTYYVSSSNPQRSDAGPGTETKPLATIAEALRRAGANTRIRLHRGDTWTRNAMVSVSPNGPGIIEAYGSGAKPRIVVTGSTAALAINGADWRVRDLEFVGPGAVSKNAGIAGRTNGAWTNELIEGCSVRGFEVGVAVGRLVGAKKYVAVVNCDIRNVNNKGIYFGGEPLAILGTTVRDTGSHAIRLWLAHKSVIAHNAVANPGWIYPCLKFHSTPHAENLTESTFSVVSYNDFYGGTGGGIGQTVATLEPQHSAADERVSDILVEGNIFRAGNQTRDLLALHARRITVRNNVFDFTGGPTAGDIKGVNVVRRGIEPTPRDNHILNNTFYRGDSSGGTTIAVFLSGDAAGALARNNAVYAPRSASTAVLSLTTSATMSHNLTVVAPHFVNPAAEDFRLLSGSPLIDAGYDDALPFDRAGQPRVDDPTTENRGAGPRPFFDVGAYEYQAP